MSANKKKDNFDYFNLLCEADEAEQKYEQLIKNGNHAPAKIKAAYSDVEKLNRQIKREGKLLDGIPVMNKRIISPVTKLYLHYLNKYPKGGAKQCEQGIPTLLEWLGIVIENNESFDGVDEVVWNDNGGITVYAPNNPDGKSVGFESIPASFARVKKMLEEKKFN